MQAGAITGYFDVAQLTLYAFWIFFAGLIIYLRREDKREGFPLVSEQFPDRRVEGFPPMPAPKTFLLPGGGTVSVPRLEAPDPVNAAPTAPWPGAALHPTGNPMLAAAGPGAYALRADAPDLTQEHGAPRVVPLRVATDHFVDEESADPRSMPVVGGDGHVAGTVTDLWIDRAETMVRYVEVALTGGGSVLAPMPLVRVDRGAGHVVIQSILSGQFADVPKLAHPDQVTLREEDRIAAFFAGGTLYAEARRTEPLL